MNKIKNLFLLALCALASLSAYGQAGTRNQNAQQVIDILTANGGYCQTIYYTASYQADMCRNSDGSQNNNMWIKDSFGNAQFVDANQYIVFDGAHCRVVTLKNAFGGLFDWDFYIGDDIVEDNKYPNQSYQPYKKTYPVIKDSSKQLGDASRYENNKYVHLQMMQSENADQYFFYNGAPLRRENVEENVFENQALQAWQAESDVHNFVNTIGVSVWGHNNFDYSIFLSPFYAMRNYFLRLSVKNGNYQNPQDTDAEDYHYDFYLAEFRHYNPNTTVGDKLNGTYRTFPAIANLDQDKNFRIYNFSNFGPSFTQDKGNGTGFGEGLNATIYPIKGQLFPDHTLLIERQPGYVHYNRGYENGDDPFDCSITKWHDSWTAGVETDEQGNYDRNNLTLKPNITGTWTGVDPHHHHMSGHEVEATNPWVTDGGTCRSREQITLNIDPYVYCTDTQLAQNQYDTDDSHARGGIYELVTANVEADITLQLAITNDIEKDLLKIEGDDDNGNRVDYFACPVEFDVTANEQYVDHYEVYIHERNGGPEVTNASDAAYNSAESNLKDAMNNTVAKYIVNKGSNDPNATGVASHYEAYVQDGVDTEKGTPIYKDVMLFKLPQGNDPVTVTVYVKAVYTTESGLAPTYHSLKNIHVQRDAIPTAVEDVNVAGNAVKAYKTIENGQIVIVRGDQRFNIMGQPIR